MKAWWAAIAVLFCSGAGWAAAPAPPTMKVMLTPSAQRAALYQDYLSVSGLLDSGQPGAALAKLKALEKQDSQNALPFYLTAYAQMLDGQSDKALATVAAGNARPYLITYLDAKGQPYSAVFLHFKHLRALARGLVPYASALPIGKRTQALGTLSGMASKTLTGRPFTAITTLVGSALHGVVDRQLGAACSAAGNAKGAAAVGDRQSRLLRLRVMVKEGVERVARQSSLPSGAGVGLTEGPGSLHAAQVDTALREEKMVRKALKTTGFLPP